MENDDLIGDIEDSILSASGTMAYNYNTYGNVTITTNGTSGLNSLGNSYMYPSSGNLGGTIWTTNTITTNPNSGLHVQGDSEFEGDVKIKGRSIMKTLEEIEKRLAILVPDPEKLEHFEALKKAYEHYKTLEALCQLPTKET